VKQEEKGRTITEHIGRKWSAVGKRVASVMTGNYTAPTSMLIGPKRESLNLNISGRNHLMELRDNASAKAR
jgi:hypothetical protein